MLQNEPVLGGDVSTVRWMRVDANLPSLSDGLVGVSAGSMGAYCGRT